MSLRSSRPNRLRMHLHSLAFTLVKACLLDAFSAMQQRAPAHRQSESRRKRDMDGRTDGQVYDRWAGVRQ
eukprot:12362771-Alexandrium_andersonii.AAC.1